MTGAKFVTSQSIDPARVKKSGGRSKPVRAMMLSVVSAIILLVGLSPFLAATGSTVSDGANGVQTASAADINKWVMCSVLPDPAPKLYQWTQTSDIQYAMRSKSSMNSGISRVDSGLNAILDLTGNNFKKVNERIIGYSLDPFDASNNADENSSTGGSNAADVENTSDDEAKKNFNKGSQVNAFDRFGVAGLNFSSYSGEWKYLVVNACGENSDPQDPKAGVYYDERLEPRSTWEEIGGSQDPRTRQFAQNVGSQFGSSFNNVVANGVFYVTKFIVTVTIGLIGFSFTDIVHLMGLEALLGGDKGEAGLFKTLYNGVFTPLILVAIAVTGINLFIDVAIRKRGRGGFMAAIRSIVLFLIAIIISVSPGKWISLPNQIAVFTQSIIMTTMNSGLVGGNGLCATDIGKKSQKSTKLVTKENQKDQKILDQASANMKSSISCQLWQAFLVRPWSEGQFGTSYDKLWAKGKTPSWAKSDESKELNNSNGKTVGDAAVPMGDGKFLNNWAIYQISTQTNAHSATGKEGIPSKVTTGVANDWWRIVDAMSNYSEKKMTVNEQGVSVPGSDKGSDSENSFEYSVPADTQVTAQWNDWVGNNSFNRVWTAFSSIPIAIVGSFGPLVFGALSAIYSVGATILMAFAPIMFLMGCWSGRGWDIFKSWGAAVVNTTMKRIAAGVLLALSLVLTISAIRMMDTLGWGVGVILLIALTIVLWKVRHMIFGMFASFNFGTSGGLNGITNTIGRRVGQTANSAFKGVGRVGGSTIAGGLGASAAGGKFRSGAVAGFKREGELFLKRSRGSFFQNYKTTSESFRTSGMSSDEAGLLGQQACSACGKVIAYEEEQNGTRVFQGGRTADGAILCQECFMDGVDPSATEFMYAMRPEQQKVAERNEALIRDADLLAAYKERWTAATNLEDTSNDSRDAIISDLKNNVNTYKLEPGSEPKALTEKARDAKLASLASMFAADVGIARKGGGTTGDVDGIRTAKIPTMLEPYLNPDVIDRAWKNGENGGYEYLRRAYAAAVVIWYQEQVGKEVNIQVKEFVEGIANKEGDFSGNKLPKPERSKEGADDSEGSTDESSNKE